MKRTIILLAATAFAQSIDTPRIGTVLGHDGVVRTLHGIAGNFTLGEATDDREPTSALRIERRGGGVFLLDAHGGIADALPQATGPVLVADNAIVYIAGGELVLRRADHSETRFALPGITLLRRIGDDYVQAGGHALRLSTAQLYMLPQPAPEGRRR